MNILQYLNENSKQQDLNYLNQTLADYGLSPKEWVVKSEKLNLYKIENRIEPDFVFEGLAIKKSGKIVWKKIYLKSV